MPRYLVFLVMVLVPQMARGEPELDRCIVQLEYILEWKDPAEIKVVRTLPLEDVLRQVGKHKGVQFKPHESLLKECKADVEAYGEQAK